jgi:hypothetical protein
MDRQPTTKEETMGTTLYNKIPLGRSPLRASRPLQAALAFGVLAGAAAVWAPVGSQK